MTRSRQLLTLTLVVLLANPLLAAPAAAQSLSLGGGGPLSPAAADAVDWFGYSPHDDAVRYGDSSDKVGVFVETASADDLDSLQDWANGTPATVLETDAGRHTALIAVEPSQIKYSLTEPDRLPMWGDSGQPLAALNYVERVDLELEVSTVDPIRNLESADSVDVEPPGATAATVLNDGTFGKGMAYDGDSPETYIRDVRPYVDADAVSENGSGVNVAVIDSGVNIGDGRVFGNGSIGSDLRVGDGHDFVEDEPITAANGYENVSDPNGHGSWVGSAAVGADGMAPGATLMPYRALDAEGSGSTSDIVKSVRRADRQGADILVMSLGSPVWNDQLATELEYALSEEGNVTAAFVAAGNSYQTGIARWTASPSDVPEVIGVQSTDAAPPANATKSYYGNVGPDTGGDLSTGESRGVTPDTAAPGQNLTAPVFTDSGTFRNTTLSGTSMAAPVAGGVGALALEANPGLEGDAETFHDRVIESGAKTPNLGTTESEGGMIDAERLVNGNTTDPAPERDLNATAAGRDTANRSLAGQPGFLKAGSRFLGNAAEAVGI
ncbi:S8 family peptidase [Natrinema thermotolerans]